MSKTQYKVLIASPWHNPKNGQKGALWTQVGIAYEAKGGVGMNVFIREGLSVSGNLYIRLEDEQPEQDAREVTRGAHYKGPVDDDDIPF